MGYRNGTARGAGWDRGYGSDEGTECEVEGIRRGGRVWEKITVDRKLAGVRVGLRGGGSGARDGENYGRQFG